MAVKNRSTDHQEWLVEELADPELAALYLTAALEDSPEMFLVAVKNVTRAKHKISDVAKQADITRESVYRSFSAKGNPAFKTFHKLLEILDIEIEFKPKSAKEASESPVAPVAVRESDTLDIAVLPSANLASSGSMAGDHDSAIALGMIAPIKYLGARVFLHSSQDDRFLSAGSPQANLTLPNANLGNEPNLLPGFLPQQQMRQVERAE
jgi:probable addiction module antidote protein